MRVSCLCPQGVNTDMLRAGDDCGARRPRSCGRPGSVLEPDAGRRRRAPTPSRDERFLILPHPEVHDYMLRKADDPERWLAGMRKLQAASRRI